MCPQIGRPKDNIDMAACLRIFLIVFYLTKIITRTKWFEPKFLWRPDDGKYISDCPRSLVTKHGESGHGSGQDEDRGRQQGKQIVRN